MRVPGIRERVRVPCSPCSFKNPAKPSAGPVRPIVEPSFSFFPAFFTIFCKFLATGQGCPISGPAQEELPGPQLEQLAVLAEFKNSSPTAEEL